MSRVLPILFNIDMVQAVLDGRKTVTRRVIKHPPHPEMPDSHNYCTLHYMDVIEQEPFRQTRYFESFAPYDKGDILYVRETWHKYTKRVGNGENCRIQEFYGYKASIANSEDESEKWRPSIHMPKEAARIWLKVTDVRVERLQEITIEQAMKEGVDPRLCVNLRHTIVKYSKIWDSTIKKSNLATYGWEANPWVWVIEFERCEKPELCTV